MKTFKLNDDVVNKNYDLVIEIPLDYEKRLENHYDKNFNFLNINYYKEGDKNFLSCKSPLSVMNTKKKIFLEIYNQFDTNSECGDIPLITIPEHNPPIPIFETTIIKK